MQQNFSFDYRVIIQKEFNFTADGLKRKLKWKWREFKHKKYQHLLNAVLKPPWLKSNQH